ncbi:hypothetical protein D3C72_1868280 [compost metagenome]
MLGKPSEEYSSGVRPSVANSERPSSPSAWRYLNATPSKLRSLENRVSVDQYGLPKRPPITSSPCTGAHDNQAWSSQRSFLARPPPSVCVDDTGPLSLPVAKRTPARVCSPRSATTPSRARIRQELLRSWRLLRSGGRPRWVLPLTS